MFQGQYLFAGDKVFSPWLPRQGDYVIATIDVVEINGTSADIQTELYTKNEEDSGDGTALAGTLTISKKGRSSKEWSGLKELVRFEFTSKNVTDGYTLFRLLNLVWFDAVAA